MKDKRFYIIIENDLFGISDRLKEIDDGYFIIYNKKFLRYEVHNKFNYGNTLCLLIPFDCLDVRTVTLAKSTRIEYIERVLSEMEKNNERIEKAEESALIEKSLVDAERLLLKGGM